jgi:chaperonin cofactor prefoldin
MWAIGMLGGLIGIYVRMETKMKELDVRVKGLEKTDNAMNEKLDRLLEMINDIRVKIARSDN